MNSRLKWLICWMYLDCLSMNSIEFLNRREFKFLFNASSMSKWVKVNWNSGRKSLTFWMNEKHFGIVLNIYRNMHSIDGSLEKWLVQLFSCFFIESAQSLNGKCRKSDKQTTILFSQLNPQFVCDVIATTNAVEWIRFGQRSLWFIIL